mgnify:CR=1 FL=1
MLIAILGVLGTVAVTMMGKQPAAVRETKLNSDVASLNHMVSAYLADGGSLAGLTSPQAVLDKMKRTRPQADWQMHTGATSGRLVDTRLKAKVSNANSVSSTQRARWNAQKQRFELTSAAGSAVTEFYLDDNLRNTDFGTRDASQR